MEKKYDEVENRGFFAIGIEYAKRQQNVGSLYRTAVLMGASYTFTIGERYTRDLTDTCDSVKSCPNFFFKDWNDFRSHVPNKVDIVGIELEDRAIVLERFHHPSRAIYLLGSEDIGLSDIAKKQCRYLIKMSTKYSLNVACCGSMIMWDRFLKQEMRKNGN